MSTVIEVQERQLEPPKLEAFYNDGTFGAVDIIKAWVRERDQLKVDINERTWKVAIFGKQGTVELLDNYWLVRTGPGDYCIYSEAEFSMRYKRV